MNKFTPLVLRTYRREQVTYATVYEGFSGVMWHSRAGLVGGIFLFVIGTTMIFSADTLIIRYLAGGLLLFYTIDAVLATVLARIQIRRRRRR